MTTSLSRASGLDRPGDAGLTEALQTAVRLLAGRLSASMGPDGSFRGRCESRVLESALTLRLLRSEDYLPRRQERLVTYLVNAVRWPEATAFDRALVQGAVHGRVVADGEQVLTDYLRDFDHFSAARKRLMLSACLVVAGAVELPATVDLARIRTAPTNVHWVNLILRSLRIILAHDRGHDADPAERETLLGELRGHGELGVWENHVTAHLLALTAAQRLEPGSEVVRHGIDRVLTCQNPDGGVPGIARLENFTTGPAGLALARSGVGGRAELDRVGRYLAGQQGTDGGWGFGAGTGQSDVDTTAYAVNCLRELGGRRYDDAFAAAGDYLAAISNHDGGFPTYVHGGSSEVAMTAGAATALAATGRHTDVVRRAVRYLVDGQQSDGTFECGWSLSEANAMWRVMWALRAVPERLLDAGLRGACRQVVTRASDRLALTQNDDGGWGHRPGDASDVTSTAYAVLSLVDGGVSDQHPRQLEHAAEYLLGQLSAEGGVSAPPDQVAPRPLPFDAPVFTEIWALLALAGLYEANIKGAGA